MPLEERSPSPQPSPPGEGATLAALGKVVNQWRLRRPQNVLPLPLGEGRGEGARLLILEKNFAALGGVQEITAAEAEVLQDNSAKVERLGRAGIVH
jgi:hypothetical protein